MTGAWFDTSPLFLLEDVKPRDEFTSSRVQLFRGLCRLSTLVPVTYRLTREQ
jgi:hypothetical protein